MDQSQLPLRPMAVPEAIGLWPIAAGWWISLLLIVLLVFAAVFWWRRRQKDPRRSALKALSEIEKNRQNLEDKELIQHCNRLLKQCALTLFPRQQVAALSGEDWLDFLVSHSRDCDRKALQSLSNGPYQQRVSCDSEALLKGCRNWIKTARVEAKDV